MASFSIGKMLLIFVAVIVAINAAVVLSPEQEKSGGTINDIRLIGRTQEGISYYTENTTLRTWYEADAYCKKIGMSLASISSPGERNLLESASTNYFYGYFWTSGRDSHDYRQFTWDDIEQQPDPQYFPEVGNWLGKYQSCVSLFKSSNTTFKIFYDSCETPNHALCRQ